MTGMTKQTVNSSVKKLIQQGYIGPLTGERNALLSLTAEGMIHVEKTVDKLIRAENKIFSAWSEEEQKRFGSSPFLEPCSSRLSLWYFCRKSSFTPHLRVIMKKPSSCSACAPMPQKKGMKKARN